MTHMDLQTLGHKLKLLYHDGLADEILFSVRWLLFPINIGLAVALLIYVVKFLSDVLTLIILSPGLTGNTLLADTVGLLDKAMVASLLVLVIIGGHQIYVRKFHVNARKDSPQWLDHIDTISMKVKVGLAFTGVSSVQLLEDFISSKHIPKAELYKHYEIHAIFLVSTLLIALVWRIMHPTHVKAESLPCSCKKNNEITHEE